MPEKIELIEFVRRFRASESQDDVAALIEHIFPALHLFILRRVPEAVDDIRAETLVTIAHNLYKIDLDSTSAEVWGFCFVIARRQIGRYLKAKKAQPYTSVDTEELSKAEAISALKGFEQSQSDAKGLGQDALELLRNSEPDCFKLLWDRYVVGLTVDEIASELKINYDTAAQRIHRSKELAGSLIKKEGLHD